MLNYSEDTIIHRALLLSKCVELLKTRYQETERAAGKNFNWKFLPVVCLMIVLTVKLEQPIEFLREDN